MTDKKTLALVSASLVALTATGALADGPGGMPPGGTMPPQAQLAFNLGSAGLLTKMNSYETYNAVQGRIGVSRAQIEFSRATGIASGFESGSNVGALPFDVLYALPGSDGHSYLRLNGFANAVKGEDGDLTQVDSASQRIDVQYMQSPNLNTLWGIGLYVANTNVDLRHNDGTIDSDAWGIRADYVQKFNDHWGVATRADFQNATAQTSVPVAPSVSYDVDQGNQFLYLQGDMVGTYTTRDAGWIPQGWVFHPILSAVYQHTEFDTATDSFGGTVSGTVGDSDEYGWVGASARFESMDFRPGKLAPYFELGLQSEFVNDLDLVSDDPTSVHGVIGASVNLGNGGRLDVEYGRLDGLNGENNDQALTVHVGYVF